MRRLRIAAAAKQDLADVVEYTAQHWGSAQARRYVLALQSTFLTLLKHPGLGIARPDLGTRLRSIGSGSHVVFYADDGDVIEVVRVLHAAADVDQAFRGESVRPPRRRPARQR